MSVCLSVQAITFECLDIETSILEWWDILTISRLNLSTKVIGWRSRSLWQNCLIWLLNTKFFCYDQLMILKCSSRSKLFQGQGDMKVKVTQGQGYLRSRSFKIKIIQVQGHSRSRSSQGHSHFKVKVILESNGNVFQFLSQCRRLAFDWMHSRCTDTDYVY